MRRFYQPRAVVRNNQRGASLKLAGGRPRPPSSFAAPAKLVRVRLYHSQHDAMGPEATLGLLFLRDGRRSGRILRELANWADLFRAILASPEGQRAILRLFSCLLMVAPDLDLEELTQQVHQAIPETENLVMTLAEKLLEQGEKRGYRSLVRRQIELKFGQLGPDALARLDAADEAAVIHFGERVLTATSVEEVLGE